MTEKPEPHIYNPANKPDGFVPTEFKDGMDSGKFIKGMNPNVSLDPNTIVDATPQGTTITEETAPDIADPPKECPPAPDEAQDAAHKQLLSDPVYAVHLHEKQLERHAQLLEEIAVRLISVEKAVIDIEESLHGADPNDPLKDYPEVKQ